MKVKSTENPYSADMMIRSESTEEKYKKT